MLSKAASTDDLDSTILIVDVRRAYFYAAATRRIFVELPDEDRQPGDDDKCGLLLQSLYGTRDAALNWERELGGFMESIGFKKGRASRCLYYNDELKAAAAVHGDDVTISARRTDAEWIKRQFEAKYEIKSQHVGQDADLAKEASILNRKVKWTSEGVQIEADPRHAAEVIRALGLEKANSVVTPMMPDTADMDAVEDGEELDETEATRYRAVAARLNYLSQDRADLAIPTMRVCSRMSRPTVDDMVRLKRVGRYLIHRPRAPYLYRWQAANPPVRSYSDSDWAGDRRTRKSVSGGALYLGGHLVKSWAKVQTSIATSSAEAELYAACKAASEGIGLQSLVGDLGGVAKLETFIDSSAALQLIHKQGLGKAKHIQVSWLWLQDAVRQKRLTVAKVAGTANPADLMTKGLAADRIRYLLDLLGYIADGGT